MKNGKSDRILGDPQASPPISPGDPHMIISPTQRPGLAGEDSKSDADPKHGHEWLTATKGEIPDLQYACVFPLPTPRDCTGKTGDCDCIQGEQTKNPLCKTRSPVPMAKFNTKPKGTPASASSKYSEGSASKGSSFNLPS